MVLDDPKLQQIGWAHEGTPETDAINDGSALYWQFGIYTREITKAHPQHMVDYRPVYKSNLLYPSDAERISTYGMGGLTYLPVNGVSLYLILGGSASAAGVHTLGGTTNIIGPGDNSPWFTTRSEMTGGTDDKFISAKGCKMASVGNNINLLSEWPVMTEGVSYNAIKTEAADHAAAYSPVLPTDDYLMNGTQINTRYARDTNTLLTWNSVDLLNDGAAFGQTIISNHKLGKISGQTEIEYIDNGRFQFLFSIAVMRGNSTELWDDYIAGTQRTLNFKIFAGATNYRDYTWTNATLTQCSAPWDEVKEGNLWMVNGFAEQLEIPVLDGIADDYYDD